MEVVACSHFDFGQWKSNSTKELLDYLKYGLIIGILGVFIGIPCILPRLEEYSFDFT